LHRPQHVPQHYACCTVLKECKLDSLALSRLVATLSRTQQEKETGINHNFRSRGYFPSELLSFVAYFLSSQVCSMAVLALFVRVSCASFCTVMLAFLAFLAMVVGHAGPYFIGNLFTPSPV
jgi:hypothetical protein